MAKKQTEVKHRSPAVVLVRDPDQPDLYRYKNTTVLNVDQVRDLAKHEDVWVFFHKPGGGSGYQRFGKPGTVGDYVTG